MPSQVPTFQKFEGERKAIYLDKLREGLHKSHAARAAGVSHALVCMYRNTHPEFREEEIEAELEANGTIENALFKTAVEGSVTAQLNWLYNRAPERWADKRAVEHSGGQIVTLQVSERIASPGDVAAAAVQQITLEGQLVEGAASDSQVSIGASDSQVSIGGDGASEGAPPGLNGHISLNGHAKLNGHVNGNGKAPPTEASEGGAP